MHPSILCITSSALLVPFSFYMNNVVRNYVTDCSDVGCPSLVMDCSDIGCPSLVMDCSDMDCSSLVNNDSSLVRNQLEDVLGMILLAAIFASQWFWSNPEHNGLSHKVDSIVAKLTIGSLLFYTMCYKNLLDDWLCISSIVVMFFFAGMSHYESSKEWCSNSHLFWHGGLHLVGSCCAIYAFI